MNALDKHVEGDGLRLHYLEWENKRKKAQVLVFVHDLGDCARSWEPFVQMLGTGFKVYALDLRGHGESGWSPEGAYTEDNYVKDIDTLLDKAKLNKPVIVGHGLGGRSALKFAAEHHKKVGPLILVDTDPDPKDHGSATVQYGALCDDRNIESMEVAVKLLSFREPNASHDILLRHAQYMTRRGPRWRLLWKRDPLAIDSYEQSSLWEILPKVSCPTLLVRGRQGSFVDHETAVKMKEAMQKCRLTEPEDSGHWIQDEFPGALATSIQWFLDSDL